MHKKKTNYNVLYCDYVQIKDSPFNARFQKSLKRIINRPNVRFHKCNFKWILPCRHNKYSLARHIETFKRFLMVHNGPHIHSVYS